MLIKNQLFANRYRLVKHLGNGAFSEVWKAEDTETGNLTVALKVYAPDKGLDEDGAKVFSEEFAIVFNIHHQNLLTPTYYAKENGSPYLVLPFCEQGSSLKLVGRMDERQAAKFLRDVSAALAYLHESEIVHQDIKPDNVLVDGKGNFLVTDFGISTRIRSTLRRSVGDKKSAGTTAYMGPERFSKNPAPVKASDVWSLGATVFELMTGDVPFGEMGGGLQRMNAEIPDIPDSYSAGLKRLVECCLAQETWDRPTAAQIRDICDGYLRTGKWDLSMIGKGIASEPDKPEKPAERKTERKVRTENEPESPRVDTPSHRELEKAKDGEVVNKRSRKWLPWVLGGIAVTAAIVMLLILMLGGQKAETEMPMAEEEPITLISDPEIEVFAQTYTVNGVSFTMKYVEGGTFQMGATSEQESDAYEDEKPVHEVTLSDFCIGETEVTQALWEAVMGTTVREQRDKADPSWSMQGEGANYPMYYVSWNEAVEFCKKLNEKLRSQLPSGYRFALPTEAQWEYAARGGNKSRHCKYAGSNSIGDVAWYYENSGSSTHPVKGKQANELGLYDMSGNVWEWCEDWYGSYSSSSQTNPTGPSSGSDRVSRGGSWNCGPGVCRVSSRDDDTPDSRYSELGFRLSLVR